LPSIPGERMKKIIFILPALLIPAYGLSQTGPSRFTAGKDQDWCETRNRIDITGGLFNGRYISCPKGMEQTCVDIAGDIQDLFYGAEAEKYYDNGYMRLNRADSGALIGAMLDYQKQKLAGMKENGPASFFYAKDISAGDVTVPEDICKKEAEDASGSAYLFYVINVKNGKAPGGKSKSEFKVLVDVNARIFISPLKQ